MTANHLEHGIETFPGRPGSGSGGVALAALVAEFLALASASSLHREPRVLEVGLLSRTSGWIWPGRRDD